VFGCRVINLDVPSFGGLPGIGLMHLWIDRFTVGRLGNQTAGGNCVARGPLVTDIGHHARQKKSGNSGTTAEASFEVG